MEKPSTENWAKYDPTSDAEANYYRLLAILHKLNETVVNDYQYAIDLCTNMLIELEMEYLKFFTNKGRLVHLRTGIFVITAYMKKLQETKSCVDLQKLVDCELYRHIKIKSPTAI